MILTEDALAKALRERDEARARYDTALVHWEAQRREDQHHLRNVLSVIRAMTRRTTDDVSNVAAYCARLDGRLAAYIHVQATVARYGEMDLETMIADELLRFGIRIGEEADLRGEPVSVGSNAAGLLALAFHELVADLMMRSDLDETATRLSIDWTWRTDDTLVLNWQSTDTGGGRRRQGRRSGWVWQALQHQLVAAIEERMDDYGEHVVLRLPPGLARSFR